MVSGQSCGHHTAEIMKYSYLKSITLLITNYSAFIVADYIVYVSGWSGLSMDSAGETKHDYFNSFSII